MEKRRNGDNEIRGKLARRKDEENGAHTKRGRTKSEKEKLAKEGQTKNSETETEKR